MTSQMYMTRANGARAQASELNRQAEAKFALATQQRDAMFPVAEYTKNRAEGEKLAADALAMTREANRLFLIAKGEVVA